MPGDLAWIVRALLAESPELGRDRANETDSASNIIFFSNSQTSSNVIYRDFSTVVFITLCLLCTVSGRIYTPRMLSRFFVAAAAACLLLLLLQATNQPCRTRRSRSCRPPIVCTTPWIELSKLKKRSDRFFARSNESVFSAACDAMTLGG